jgi:hypothetical protein
MDEWGDFLPIFRERKEDNPAEHLREFHELMHQWEIHHEDVLLNMFMFSLAGDACEWYHSLPPSSISSLGEFHAAFNRHCQKFYSSKLICHNCCEEYKDCVQGMTVSNEICEDESYEDEICEEEGYTSDELVKLVQALSTKIEKLEADRACCSYEGDAEDFPVLGADVLGSPSHDGEVEDCIAIEATYSSPDAPVISDLNEEIVMYSDEEQKIPASYFDDSGEPACV